jgi:CRISPR-associated protein Cmr4
MTDLVYLYLLSPLHTGGTSQEGNLVGIAREAHTDLPYVPSSTIRGRLRASTPSNQRSQLWGNTIDDVTSGTDNQLTQGHLWVGDGSILWLPVPSLSHGVVWVSCPMLLHRWARLQPTPPTVPPDYSTSLGTGSPLYLKDAILQGEHLHPWEDWTAFIPKTVQGIHRVLVLPDHHCATLVQMSLWRQVKVSLNEHKTVSGGFRFEEAIPPDTLMYFPWGTTAQANGAATNSTTTFHQILAQQTTLQFGGQESLGRGFTQISTQISQPVPTAQGVTP